MRACLPPPDATKGSSTLRRRIRAAAPPMANKVPGIRVTGGSHRRVAETCGQGRGGSVQPAEGGTEGFARFRPERARLPRAAVCFEGGDAGSVVDQGGVAGRKQPSCT